MIHSARLAGKAVINKYQSIPADEPLNAALGNETIVENDSI
jgi:hypothetical protein